MINKTSILKRIFVHRSVIIAIVSILVTAGGVTAYQINKEDKLDTVVATKQSLKEIVSVTGRVKSAREVNLSFESGGRVSWIIGEEGYQVRSGQAIAYVSNSDTQADLAQAEALLKSEEARLESLKNGAKPEEIALQEARVLEAKKNLGNALRESFTKSDNAIRAKAYKIFDDLRSDNSFPLQSNNSSLAREIEDLKIESNNLLNKWQDLLYEDPSNLYLKSGEVKTYLGSLSLFVDKLNQAVNEVEQKGSVNQTTLQSYRSQIYDARTSLNLSLSLILSAEEKLEIETRTLNLKESAASNSELKAQEALVEKAKASVLRYRSELGKKSILSPIDGVITKMDIRVGETVGAGVPVVGVIGESGFEMESFIPEADIEKVTVGDKATVTLDAYGSDILFEAVVSQIDPAETLLEGVPTYKTILSFKVPDERIKSGMTANIDIITEEKANILAIPTRAILYLDDADYVNLLQDGGNIKQVKIDLGIRDESGLIEIRGISEGDIIVIPE